MHPRWNLLLTTALYGIVLTIAVLIVLWPLATTGVPNSWVAKAFRREMTPELTDTD
jgi:hypothetical protein